MIFTPRPRPPATTSATTTKDVHIVRTRSHGTRDVLDQKIHNGNTACRVPSGTSVFVILLDDDAVIGYIGDLDVFVGDTFYANGGTVDGFDADAWMRMSVSCML